MNNQIAKNLRFNVLLAIVDGGFFGWALGVASFVTVIPLFISTFTTSAVIIGLIPALRTIGWQLPQLFMAGSVSRQTRYKPMVMLMTISERVPFLCLAGLAWFSPSLNPNLVLVLAFLLLAWQGLGGGLTAPGWQSMIAKIIPPRHRGKFFGTQSAAANLAASVGAIVSGIILVNIVSPRNYALCFFLAAVGTAFSFLFLALVREPAHTVVIAPQATASLWKQAGGVLQRDRNFSWFVVARTFSQFATMATSFYAIYAVRILQINAETAGIMTSVLLAAQIVANPIMGGLGDKYGHRAVMILGMVAAFASALLAWFAGTLELFYVVFALAGIANVALWATSITMTLEFGTEAERPLYVGLANTLIVPATIAAPVIGGWIADTFGFGMTFLLSIVCALITMVILQFYVRDVPAPHHLASAEKSAA